MKVKKSRAIEAFIPTSSMADIAFLLIIFFMVSSVFPKDKTQMDLPITAEVENYKEESAVIAISTDKLIEVRNLIDRPLSSIYGQEEKIIIKSSNGLVETTEIYSSRASMWDMTDVNQYDQLKNVIREFLKQVERRRESEGKQISIVLKVDKKAPFYAVDGVIQALQDLGGETAQGVAILSKLGG